MKPVTVVCLLLLPLSLAYLLIKLFLDFILLVFLIIFDCYFYFNVHFYRKARQFSGQLVSFYLPFVINWFFFFIIKKIQEIGDKLNSTTKSANEIARKDSPENEL